MREYQNIKYEISGHIAVITINHPPANTWNLATLTDFEDAIDQVENNANIRVLLSKRLTAEEALKIGLINYLTSPDTLMPETLALAKTLADRPPIAVRCVLDAVTAGLYEGIDAGLDTEAQGSITVRASDDCREGFAAFLEKRKPVFTGK